MTSADRQKLYDEIVEFDNAHVPGDDWRPFWKMWEHAMWTSNTTPEEAVASQLVTVGAYSEPRRKSAKYDHFAAVNWAYGDARGVLRAGGRTFWEARLRLRDKLAESARKEALRA